MEENTTGKIIIAALSTLTPPQITAFAATISSLFHHHRRRLSTLLSSHTLFSLSLHHLHSLSLHQKSLLIAKHLLSILSHLSHFLHPTTALTPPNTTTTFLSNRDLDSVLLLLLLCELHQHDPESLKKLSPTDWRSSLSDYTTATATTLTLSGIGFSTSETLTNYIEVVTKCRKFVDVMGCGDGKEGKEVAASVAAVVALPSVEVKHGGIECVICKEKMSLGRDVCEFPCEHKFHWMCILPWVIKRNTCPCCRHRLPTDDVYGEIERQWEAIVKIGGSYF